MRYPVPGFSFCRRAWMLAVLLCAGSVLACGQSNAVVLPGRRAELQRYLTDLSRFGFSGVVLVAQRDSVIASVAGGWAYREHAIPNTLGTAFSLGSLSKQFTATAILRLEMTGRLHVTDPLKHFFPDAPRDKAGITVGQLLSHQGGVASLAGGRDCLTRDEAQRAILDAPLHFAPGTSYEYSNAGFNLLAIIVEIVSGEPFETFVQQELWDRAGLKRTGFISDEGRWTASDVAQGYDVTVAISPYAPRCQWNRKGGGGAISTAGDLLLWQQALAHGAILDSTRLAGLYQRQVATDEDSGADYAYGWFTGHTSAGGRVIFHGGNLLPDGFNTDLSQYPDDSLTVIVLSNMTVDAWGAQRTPVLAGIEAILFGGRYGRPPSLPDSKPVVNERYLGVYETDAGSRFIVAAEPSGLAIGAEGQATISALVRPSSGWDEDKARTFNEVVEKFIPLAARKDTQAVALALGDIALARRAVRTWNEVAGQKGDVLRTEVLGSVMIGEGDGPATYVRITFAQDTAVFRVWWDWEGGFLSIHDGEELPARHVLVAMNEHDLLGWDMFNAHTLRVHFDLDPGGSARSLTIETPSGPVRATRVR